MSRLPVVPHLETIVPRLCPSLSQKLAPSLLYTHCRASTFRASNLTDYKLFSNPVKLTSYYGTRVVHVKKRCGNAPTRRIVPCRGLDRGKGAGGCKSDFFLLHELLWRSVGSPLSQPKVVPTGNNPSLQMQTQSNIEALCDVSRV